MKCHNCGAGLNIDIDRMQGFCPHCGQKVLFDIEQVNQIVKEKIESTRIQEEQQTQRVKIAYDASQKHQKSDNIIATILIVFVIGLIGFMFYWAKAPSKEEKEHSEHLEYLQQLEIEIEDAIRDGDYDLAELKVTRLYSDNWSDEDTKTWDEKRERFLKIIQNRKDRK